MMTSRKTNKVVEDDGMQKTNQVVEDEFMQKTNQVAQMRSCRKPTR